MSKQRRPADTINDEEAPESALEPKTGRRAAKPRGRPKSATEAVAKAIYFRDAGQIDKLNEIVKQHPDGSLSRIVQQLVAEFCKAYESKAPEDRKMVFSATVYL